MKFILYAIPNNKSEWHFDYAISLRSLTQTHTLRVSTQSKRVCVSVCAEQIIMPFKVNVPKCSRRIYQHFDDDQQTASLKRLWTLTIAHKCLELSLHLYNAAHILCTWTQKCRMFEDNSVQHLILMILIPEHVLIAKETPNQPTKKKLLWQIHWTAIVWSSICVVWNFRSGLYVLPKPTVNSVGFNR